MAIMNGERVCASCEQPTCACAPKPSDAAGCKHEAWEQHASGGRTCADCRAFLTSVPKPPTHVPVASDAARKAAEEIVTERMASDLLFAFFGDPPTPQEVQKQRAQMIADGAAFIQRAIDSETAARLWTCPACAFSFSREHADEGGGYSCPLCETAAAYQRGREDAAKVVEAAGPTPNPLDLARAIRGGERD